MDPEGMHLGNPKTAPIFIKNFFADFRTVLGKNHKIKDFKKCDFEPIRRHLNEKKIIRKAITDEERKMNKDSKNETMFKFGYSLVDGHLEKVGNYNMEPPGAFRGRGEHPKMGKLKQRVAPEQVMRARSSMLRARPCMGGPTARSDRSMALSVEREYQQSGEVHAACCTVEFQREER